MLNIVENIFKKLKYSITNFKEDPLINLGYIFPFIFIISSFSIFIVMFTQSNELLSLFYKIILFLIATYLIIISINLYKISSNKLRILTIIVFCVICFQIILLIVTYLLLNGRTISKEGLLYNLLNSYSNVKLPLKEIIYTYIFISLIAILLYLFLIIYYKDTRDIVIYMLKTYFFLFLISIVTFIVCIIKIASGGISLAGKISDKIDEQRLKQAKEDLEYSKRKQEKYSELATVYFEKASGERLTLDTKERNIESANRYSMSADKEKERIKQLEEEINRLEKK